MFFYRFHKTKYFPQNDKNSHSNEIKDRHPPLPIKYNNTWKIERCQSPCFAFEWLRARESLKKRWTSREKEEKGVCDRALEPLPVMRGGIAMRTPSGGRRYIRSDPPRLLPKLVRLVHKLQVVRMDALILLCEKRITIPIEWIMPLFMPTVDIILLLFLFS